MVPGTGMQDYACVVPGVSWALGKRVSFYRFIVIVTDIVYRNSVGAVFLIVSFPNDNTETFGTISTTNVHILRFLDSIPTIFLYTFLAVLV